jgi:hypothetical protein
MIVLSPQRKMWSVHLMVINFFCVGNARLVRSPAKGGIRMNPLPSFWRQGESVPNNSFHLILCPFFMSYGSHLSIWISVESNDHRKSTDLWKMERGSP